MNRYLVWEKYVSMPHERLAQMPVSSREALLMLSVASKTREAEKRFDLYLKIASRRKRLEKTWQEVVASKEGNVASTIPILARLLHSCSEARITALTELSVIIDLLTQYADELSKFANVNKITAERLWRQIQAGKSAEIKKALAEEVHGRHVLAECEREISKRIVELTTSSQPYDSKSDLVEFINSLDSDGMYKDRSPAEALEQGKNNSPKDFVSTLTVRGGIAERDHLQQRQQVSETPTPCFMEVELDLQAEQPEEQRKLSLSAAVQDLEVDSTRGKLTGQNTLNSSDESRKTRTDTTTTPSFTPNETANSSDENQKSVLNLHLVSRSPVIETQAGNKSADKAARSPWATPGSRLSGLQPKLQGSESVSKSPESQQAERGSGDKKDNIQAALNFDEIPKHPSKSSNPNHHNSTSDESQNLSLPMNPSPPLTAST